MLLNTSSSNNLEYGTTRAGQLTRLQVGQLQAIQWEQREAAHPTLPVMPFQVEAHRTTILAGSTKRYHHSDL
jgi:hypothetical protein